MDELEAALEKYLTTNFDAGALVTSSAMGDEVAPHFISQGARLSDILTGIRKFLRRQVKVTVLMRVGAGVYRYWPDGRPETTGRAVVPIDSFQRAPGITQVLPLVRENVPFPFDSVGSLARSDEFLVQRGLANVNFDALQELSF